MNKIRCDAVVVQLIVTEIDEAGRPIGELPMQPVKMFLAKVPDISAEIARQMAEFEKARA